MPALPKTLNALVSWTGALDLLGVTTTPILPALARCPLCQQEQLSITADDGLAGGQWFYCWNCRKTGDMIELIAKASHLSIEGTVHLLTQQGFELPTEPAIIKGYKEQHVGYRLRLNRLWRQAQSYLYHSSTDLRSLLSELQLPYEFPAEHWDAGPAKILGGEQCPTIEKAMLPGSVVCCTGSQSPWCRSETRVFKGGKWKEALMMPFYVLPGRISAFGLLGRQGRIPEDYLVRTAHISVANRAEYREVGLAMHPDAPKLAVNWQRTVFAVEDPLTYLYMHLKHFQQSNEALPLVLWHDRPDRPYRRTQRAWEMFDGCRIVFWDPAMSLTTLRHAIRVGGWITRRGPLRADRESLQNYLGWSSTDALCHLLRRHALPWPQALAKAMPKWTDAKITDCFLRLQLESGPLEKVRKACDQALRDRLDSVLSPELARGYVRCNKCTVVEKPDGWFAFPSRDWARNHLELVCNAKLRVSKIVVHEKIDQSVYVGTIFFNGAELPFVVPRKTIEKNPFKWMRDFLLPYRLGQFRYESNWSRRLLSVADLFHPAELVQGLDTVGWDQSQMAFRLPGYTIGLDGVKKQPVHEDVSLLPAANLCHATDPLPVGWGKLDDKYASALFWGALSCLLNNILAPALIRPTRGIGLVGPGAEQMGAAVAKEAGCLMRRITQSNGIAKLVKEEQQHRWPLYVSFPATAKITLARWFDAACEYQKNCVTPMAEELAEKYANGDRWRALIGVEPIDLSWNLPNWPLLGMVKRLVPAYLRDVCERHLKVGNVLKDMAAFVARQGGEIDVPQVEELLWSLADET